ncbi:MAG TPA: helix-turn-helix domain-containing protein [Bacteroidales bacterium]|jgi:DNA-binding transcriptional ArsR family regulator|nr:helix-turn-helix domain-containing protein [Bacteroidales bacterium]HOL98578.1 helix-turn-helix domain-containing protein [Bacteroidales bacterium]HOM36904.1 helix-turn-helix domain-containing protein [Bacteroidales bacterium]HPD24426.1 helix-turn-helix domain-containing protein [Bacteroidales bacterium]HRT00274.1 helix-turn-helix domain-containing protein [Bacteroidales bacterium]
MNNRTNYSEDVLLMAKYAKALAHPVRIYILKKLSKMNSCCYSGDLVDELPIKRSTLSQHLKELKYVGLIQGEIEPPFIKYCLNTYEWEKLKNIFSELLND